MTNNQIVLAFQAKDELEQFKCACCLIEIALEQLDNPLDEHEQTVLRCQILLDQFSELMNQHLDRMSNYLQRITS